MEQLIVLGTGNAQAIHCYNTCYAMKKGEEYFLVDAGGGNGILSQLDKASIPLEKIHHIFVTHAHNDHILGMVWMIRMIATSMNKGTYDGTLTIYCHEELLIRSKRLQNLRLGRNFTNTLMSVFYSMLLHIAILSRFLKILLPSLILVLQRKNSLVLLPYGPWNKSIFSWR